ncbi:MAG: GIY-YIG nuclease family protein [Spongiibacteraceae bacterium]
MSPWWVYMVRSQSGKYYTGITTDVERRFKEHCGSKRGARFFRGDPASEVVYREAAENRSAASIREAAIKKLSRSDKEKIIVTALAAGDTSTGR